jgi:DNA-binding transcriptional ArsR family regulator
VKVNDGKEKVEPVWLEENRKRLESAARILAEIETAKAKRTEYEAKIQSLDEELVILAGRYEQIRDELDEAMTLSGIRRPKKPKAAKVSKPRDPNAPKRTRGHGFKDKVLELLYRDGGSYHVASFVEDFGGTRGSAEVSLNVLRREGLIESDGQGNWSLTENGVAEMKRRAMTGADA